ncbi:MAG: hypothetical protein ACXVLQ_01330 [Bacteriovorax sp.]
MYKIAKNISKKGEFVKVLILIFVLISINALAHDISSEACWSNNKSIKIEGAEYSQIASKFQNQSLVIALPNAISKLSFEIPNQQLGSLYIISPVNPPLSSLVDIQKVYVESVKSYIYTLNFNGAFMTSYYSLWHFFGCLPLDVNLIKGQRSKLAVSADGRLDSWDVVLEQNN